MRKTEEEQGAKLVRAMAGVLLGGVLALGVCLMFLFACSVGISGGWLKETMMYQLAVAGCVVGGFVGGAFSVHRLGHRSLAVGMATGGIFFLLLLTAGLLIFDNMSAENGGLGLLSGCLCGGAVAGLLGRRSPKKKGHSNQKRR